MANPDSDNEPHQSTSWHALSDLKRWEREIERLFDDFLDRRMGRARGGSEAVVRGADLPALDLYYDGGELVARVELPGFEKQDIDVTVTEHTVSVAAEKKKPEEIKEANYYRVERVHGPVRRRIELPAAILPERVRARFKNGVLEIRMARSESTGSKADPIAVD